MDHASFGAALRERRRATGITQRDLAARLDLDFSYISKIENGRLPPPSADTIVAICEVLAVPPEGLLALGGKLPSDVASNVSSDPMGQRFLLEAQRMSLTTDEWRHLTDALRNLREG